MGTQLGAALFDVPDEVLIDVAGKLKVADQALALGVGLSDGAVQGLDVAGLLVLRGLGVGFLGGVQQGVAVGTAISSSELPHQRAAPLRHDSYARRCAPGTGAIPSVGFQVRRAAGIFHGDLAAPLLSRAAGHLPLSYACYRMAVSRDVSGELASGTPSLPAR